jgi:FeoC like transcriptional regulator
MLERLLCEIRSGGALEVGALAARLGTSPAMVQAMLEHLQRLGYIQPYGEECGEGCGGCSLSQSCDPASHSKKISLWKYQE